MTLEQMRRQLEGVRQCLPLGHTLQRGELLCHLAGLVLDDQGILHLVALEFDPEYPIWLEQQDQQEVQQPERPRKNRELILHRQQPSFRRISEAFPEKICFGQLELKPTQWDSEYNGEKRAALFFKLLHQGWNPGQIGQIPLKDLLFSRWTFEGQYEQIPQLDPQAPILFQMQSQIEQHLVELPLVLTVGQGTEKIEFIDKTSGETLWMQILQTRLDDMWAQLEQVFAHHRQQGQIPLEQIDQMQAQFERDFAQECPRGMVYPVIEYQCQQDFQLEFYLPQYLDSLPDSSGHSTGFLVRPEQQETPEGRKIRAAVLQSPVAPDTKTIQAELFCLLKHTDEESILFELQQ